MKASWELLDEFWINLLIEKAWVSPLLEFCLSYWFNFLKCCKLAQRSKLFPAFPFVKSRRTETFFHFIKLRMNQVGAKKRLKNNSRRHIRTPPHFIVKAFCKLHISNQKHFLSTSRSSFARSTKERKTRLISHQIVYTRESRRSRGEKSVRDILQFADAPANPFMLCEAIFYTKSNRIIVKVDSVDTQDFMLAPSSDRICYFFISCSLSNPFPI